MSEPPQEHCEISRDGNLVHAISEKLKLTIVEGPGDKARAINRNAKRIGIGSGEVKAHDRMLMGELDGVRVYAKIINGTAHLIMTKQDLYL